MKTVSTFYEFGVALGYPLCCAKSFSEGRFAFCLSDSQLDALQASGGPMFVPCEKHTADIIEGRETLASLVGREHNLSNAEMDQIEAMLQTSEQQMLTNFLDHKHNTEHTQPMERTIYSTKYALTQGIQTYPGCTPGTENGVPDPDSEFWYYRGTSDHVLQQFVLGRTGFFTREEAEKRADLIRQRKIKALNKQLAALQAMDFSK